ncbi:hypothetical protein J3458_000018 [Metarhizium acridum]|uniref:uncharacterized protein n=1 Tax=Metarhizium acridum TaxID=92637 RepID=UPI001C6CFCB9|nr:hypothetical protein J3458_000018 [Metarhizium acridum]
MGINEKLINDLVAKAAKAAEQGTKLNFEDPDEAGQYMLSILAMATGFIPVVGTSLSALTGLLSSVLFPDNSTEKIWKALLERIEQLIDTKIEKEYLSTLEKTIQGLDDNLDLYGQQSEVFKKASGNQKQIAARALGTQHSAFRTSLLLVIPLFQAKSHQVASLPWFAIAANIHLLLLRDGIKHGKEWNYYSDGNIENMKKDFKHWTSPGSAPTEYRKSLSQEASSLKKAISEGKKLGLPAKLLETWQTTYDEFVESDENYDDIPSTHIDYVSYVKQVYEEGRKKVKPYPPVLRPEDLNMGAEVAGKMRAYADYDRNMITHVLAYSELWPWMVDGTTPPQVLKNLDREVFCGPFGRYAKHTTWSETSPPTIDDRRAAITSVYIRGWDDVDCVWIQYGDSWGDCYGSRTAGVLQELALAHDEYITSVGVSYGFKLGSVKFTSNKNRTVKVGDARNGDKVHVTSAPKGYALTSVYITNWESHIPPGCEGIILGFRRLITHSP